MLIKDLQFESQEGFKNNHAESLHYIDSNYFDQLGKNYLMISWAEMKTSQFFVFCYMAISKGSFSKFQNQEVLDHLITGNRNWKLTRNVLESIKYFPQHNYYWNILIYWKFLISNKDAEVNENITASHLIYIYIEAF